MMWIRVDRDRLESNPPGWSIETYRCTRSVSTHVRRNGRLVKYAHDENDAIQYIENNTKELPNNSFT